MPTFKVTYTVAPKYEVFVDAADSTAAAEAVVEGLLVDNVVTPREIKVIQQVNVIGIAEV